MCPSGKTLVSLCIERHTQVRSQTSRHDRRSSRRHEKHIVGLCVGGRNKPASERRSTQHMVKGGRFQEHMFDERWSRRSRSDRRHVRPPTQTGQMRAGNYDFTLRASGGTEEVDKENAEGQARQPQKRSNSGAAQAWTPRLCSKMPLHGRRGCARRCVQASGGKQAVDPTSSRLGEATCAV